MEELLLLSKAFSDMNRMNIVTLIYCEKELCVCEISDTLNLSQPLISRHLKQLKQANILESYQDGKWIIYTITSRPSKILEAYLTELKKLEHRLDSKVVCSIR